MTIGDGDKINGYRLTWRYSWWPQLGLTAGDHAVNRSAKAVVQRPSEGVNSGRPCPAAMASGVGKKDVQAMPPRHAR